MKRPLIQLDGIPSTPLGAVWAAASPRGLVRVDFGIARTSFERQLRAQIPCEIAYARGALATALLQVREYLEGRRRDFDLDIDWQALASDFQRAALRRVYAIPYGQTRTYAQIAAQIGHPGACRAMGRANATNPMPLVIPCHRVIGTDGTLHGYGGKGGLRTKAWLLRMEKENA